LFETTNEKTRLPSTTGISGSSMKVLSLAILAAISIGIAMPLVLTFIETGTIGMYQMADAHRCVSGGGTTLSCSNVGTQNQVNSGSNAAAQ
jgi:hypothetical protein